MSTFVLIAGAWHGAWCWQRVIPLLTEAGHRVLAPDLLGMGEDTTPLAGVTLAAWADQVATLIEREAERVILVGHSRGGIVISEAAERSPGRIATLVYLAGSLIPTGDTVFGTLGKPEPGAADMLHIRDDGAGMISPKYVGPLFYNETPADWVAIAERQLSPEPLWIHAAPLSLTPARFGHVPRAYIETRFDHAMPLEMQRSMQAALPCDPVFTLDSDHPPFFSNPEALVRCLLALAAKR